MCPYIPSTTSTKSTYFQLSFSITYPRRSTTTFSKSSLTTMASRSSSLTLRLLAASLVAFLCYTLLASLLRRWKARSYTRAPTPPTAPWWDFYGVTVPMSLTKALAENRILEYVKSVKDEAERAEGRRVTTYEMTMMGRRTFMTTDVKNTQAMLAHQFQDFGLGEYRIASFLPMLGVGIVRWHQNTRTVPCSLSY
jgi:hypothetical protein